MFDKCLEKILIIIFQCRQVYCIYWYIKHFFQSSILIQIKYILLIHNMNDLSLYLIFELFFSYYLVGFLQEAKTFIWSIPDKECCNMLMFSSGKIMYYDGLNRRKNVKSILFSHIIKKLSFTLKIGQLWHIVWCV